MSSLEETTIAALKAIPEFKARFRELRREIDNPSRVMSEVYREFPASLVLGLMYQAQQISEELEGLPSLAVILTPLTEHRSRLIEVQRVCQRYDRAILDRKVREGKEESYEDLRAQILHDHPDLPSEIQELDQEIALATQAHEHERSSLETRHADALRSALDVTLLQTSSPVQQALLSEVESYARSFSLPAESVRAPDLAALIASCTSDRSVEKVYRVLSTAVPEVSTRLPKVKTPKTPSPAITPARVPKRVAWQGPIAAGIAVVGFSAWVYFSTPEHPANLPSAPKVAPAGPQVPVVTSVVLTVPVYMTHQLPQGALADYRLDVQTRYGPLRNSLPINRGPAEDYMIDGYDSVNNAVRLMRLQGGDIQLLPLEGRPTLDFDNVPEVTIETALWRHPLDVSARTGEVRTLGVCGRDYSLRCRFTPEFERSITRVSTPELNREWTVAQLREGVSFHDEQGIGLSLSLDIEANDQIYGVSLPPTSRR